MKDAGLATVGANFTYPVSTPAITITDRFMHVYWAYEASEIADSDLPTVLRVSDLGSSLGALIVQTIAPPVALTGGMSIGPNPTGESSKIGGYAIVPYSAT